MVPGRRVRSFIGRAESAAKSQPGHRKTPEARTTATVAAAADAAKEVTAAAASAMEDYPHLLSISSLLLALSFALALSDSLALLNTPVSFSLLHTLVRLWRNSLSLVCECARVTQSTFLRGVHVGDTTTLSGLWGLCIVSPSSRSPFPSPSSISDQRKDCDTKLGDAFSRYEPLPRTNREFSLKAKLKLGLFPDDIQAD